MSNQLGPWRISRARPRSLDQPVGRRLPTSHRGLVRPEINDRKESASICGTVFKIRISIPQYLQAPEALGKSSNLGPRISGGELYARQQDFVRILQMC